jgi:hypothetical protein
LIYSRYILSLDGQDHLLAFTKENGNAIKMPLINLLKCINSGGTGVHKVLLTGMYSDKAGTMAIFENKDNALNWQFIKVN